MVTKNLHGWNVKIKLTENLHDIKVCLPTFSESHIGNNKSFFTGFPQELQYGTTNPKFLTSVLCPRIL